MCTVSRQYRIYMYCIWTVYKIYVLYLDCIITTTTSSTKEMSLTAPWNYLDFCWFRSNSALVFGDSEYEVTVHAQDYSGSDVIMCWVFFIRLKKSTLRKGLLEKIFQTCACALGVRWRNWSFLSHPPWRIRTS